MTLINKIREQLVKVTLWGYRNFYVPFRGNQIRKKDRVRVGFVLVDLGCWKTETLYLEMLKNPRFEPLLLIGISKEENDSQNIIQYLESKGYNYTVLDESNTIVDQVNPDIIFYQKPYEGQLPFSHWIRRNLKALFCVMPYGMREAATKWGLNTQSQNIAWQVYFENLPNWVGASKVMTNKSKNGYVTGIPVMDEMQTPKSAYNDPWAPQDKPKKRIIYAPHHTVSQHWINYSTFLDYYEFMLEMAEKYKDEVQWAFKPHPLLYYKLMDIWGQEKTDAYYDRWRNLSNTQYVEGKYVDLFKYSDAMIHDCGSFTIEYMYENKPVMYLVRDEHITDNNMPLKLKAFALHEKGYCKDDIENFIQQVIAGNKFNEKGQLELIETDLKSPYGRTACENVIDCILSPSFAKKARGRNLAKKNPTTNP